MVEDLRGHRSPPPFPILTPPHTHSVDLLLAMQAPIRLERMLPHIAALGVGRLVIAGANKVRKVADLYLLRPPRVPKQTPVALPCPALAD